MLHHVLIDRLVQLTGIAACDLQADTKWIAHLQSYCRHLMCLDPLLQVRRVAEMWHVSPLGSHASGLCTVVCPPQHV